MARPLLPLPSVERCLLSLCMIVRDEEALLPRSLASAAAYVDEVVVADTGSTDATPALAEAHGARVLRIGWQDDFSAARNASIEAAHGRFVLILDADEWIDSGCAPGELRRRLRTGRDEAYSVDLVDHVDGGTVRHSTLVRLFRNRAEHRYAGIIHEQITPSIARRLRRHLLQPTASGLIVGHDGYRLDHRTERNKNERNLRLLRLQVDRAPADAGSRYFLLRELVPVRTGRAVPGRHIAEALRHAEELEAGLEALPAPLQADTVRLHAAALVAAERPADALRLLERRCRTGMAFELLRADAELALAGDAAAGSAALERSLERLRRGFDDPDPGDLPSSDRALDRVALRTRAAEILVRLGRLGAAAELAAQARTLPGGAAPGWRVEAALERAADNPPGVLRACLQALREDEHDPWTWMELGTWLLARGEAHEAIRALTRAAALAPGWTRAESALAAARGSEAAASGDGTPVLARRPPTAGSS